MEAHVKGLPKAFEGPQFPPEDRLLVRFSHRLDEGEDGEGVNVERDKSLNKALRGRANAGTHTLRKLFLLFVHV